MSNHFSGPDFSFPNGDARVDICDLYAFPKPADPNRSILIMDVNPLAPTQGNSFADDAIYEIKIDTDGDAVADIAYRFRFSPIQNGTQTVTVRRAEGPEAAAMGGGGDILLADGPVSFDGDARVITAGDHRFFAGIRSDPFFADVDGANKGFQFTGADFLSDKDVFCIALDVPNSVLGPSPKVGLWCRVLVPTSDASLSGNAAGAGWVQVDRAGRPTQVNLYCEKEDKVAYNGGEPVHDRALWTGKFAHALEHMGKYSPEEARAVAESLLPDILPYDYTRPAGYPDSGRTLTDDVFDYCLSRATNGNVSDGAGPHKDLLSEFPYLGTPHSVEAVLKAA